MSGDFTEEGLTDDITGLTPSDYIGLEDWVKFYKKDYKYVGKISFFSDCLFFYEKDYFDR